MRDLLILLLMLVFIGLGVFGAIKNQGIAFKIGSIFSAIVVCVGLAYFGWMPFLGGQHQEGTYFGCIMLSFGILFWLFFFGIKQDNNKIKNNETVSSDISRR